MRLTSLYRSVAPWHPALAWVWMATTLTFVSTWYSHGMHAGFRGAVTVFLAWAITRELAPRRRVAAAAAPFAAIGFAIPAHTDLLACLGVLLAARISTRSVGDPPTRLDLVALVGMASWMATRTAGLPVAVVLAAVIASDVPPRVARVAGLLAVTAAVSIGALEGTLTARPGWGNPSLASQVLFACTCAAAAWLLVQKVPARIRARDDRHGDSLRGSRIRSARIAVVACLAAEIGWTGLDGAWALSAASAAVLVSGCFGGSVRSSRRIGYASAGTRAQGSST